MSATWRARSVGDHFTMGEFFPPGSRKPPPSAFRAVEHLVQGYLDPARDLYGRCIVHSGHRTKARNAAVGGVVNSYHRYDLRDWLFAAADVSFERGNPGIWYVHFDRAGVGGLGRYRTHVHVDDREQHSRW